MLTKKTQIIFIVTISVIISLGLNYLLFNSDSEKEEENTASQNVKEATNQVSAVVLPNSIDFAGERVPLELYYVKEHLEWELNVNTYLHATTILTLKRTKRWFPVIEPILKKHGIPDDFKFLSLIESSFKNGTSPAGAVGFWQFLKGTAQDYGLEVNSEVDERYHVEKSTEAACKYLNKAYEKYRNWTMVAAAYNAGNRGVDRQVERQKENNYYNLLLNEETERYVFRILALKLIVNKPGDYNFNLRPDEYYQPIPYHIEEVKGPVRSWADFAQKRNLTYRLIKEANPWLRQPDLKNRQKKTYQIKIPEVQTQNVI